MFVERVTLADVVVVAAVALDPLQPLDRRLPQPMVGEGRLL